MFGKRQRPIILLIAAAFSLGQSKEESIGLEKTVLYGSIVEGTISSVNIEQNMFVMKAKLSKMDTLYLDSSAIVKAGPMVIQRKDLKLNESVQANYTIKNGKKIAAQISTYPNGNFLSDTTDLGNEVFIAEGTIGSINHVGSMIIIKAAIGKEMIFSLDSNAVIKSGKTSLVLKDLKPNSDVKVGYTEKGRRKIATTVTTKSK